MTTNTLQLDLTGSSDEEMNSILGAACHLGEVDPEVDIQIRVSGSSLNKLFHMDTPATVSTTASKQDTAPPPTPAPSEAPKKNTRFRMTNAEKDAGLSLEQAKEFRAQADETGNTLSQFCDSVGLGEDTETETPDEPTTSEETAAPETETPPAEPDLEYDRDIKARVAKALGAGADRTALKKLAKKHGGETFKDVDPSRWPEVIEALEALIAESGDIA